MIAVTYEEFLRGKVRFDRRFGFAGVEPSDINPMLFDHQRAIVRWCVEGGRRAVFAAFGLGKTFIQLETLRIVRARAGGRALVVCPLGVRGEFRHDADLLGISTRFVRRTDELDVDVDWDGIYLTNYESVREGRLDVDVFTVVSLDEASVLRSFGSKTYQEFLTLFADVPYRYVATATPSPNRYKELIHYAGFEGVMDTGQALTRFFQRNSEKANDLTLYPHKEQEFWLWLASWSVFVQTPGDLGYSDDGYVLPPLQIVRHEVAVDHQARTTIDRDGQALLFRDAAIGVADTAKEKRATLEDRVAKVMELVRRHVAGSHLSDAAPDDPWTDQVVIWCDLNDEQRAIEKALDDADLAYSSIYGSLDVDEAERRLDQWRNRETYALIGKPVMLGQGLNLQQSSTAIFAGVTYKFNDTIQAVHRIYRFGQTRPCTVHIIHAESERAVMAALDEKWEQHRRLTATMSNVIREHGLNQAAIDETLARTIGVERVEASGEGWLVANNDCVAETTGMPDNSVDHVLTSIPFSNHYEYTPSYNDFGHTDDNDHFWAQMDFLTPQLLRILRPGRIYACHVKDRILFGNVTGKGAGTVSPFHAEALMHGIKHGFDYLGMIVVTTDVVRENNQSYRLGWSEVCKDSTKIGVGSPEYVLLFRKPQSDTSKGYADTPVAHSKEQYSRARWQTDAHAHWRSSGDRLITGDELAALPTGEYQKLFTEWMRNRVYDYECHVRIGEELDAVGRLPADHMALDPGTTNPDVWTDVIRMRTLNSTQAQKRLAQHVCPLPFDIVDRLIERFTNPGELVFDPFGGLFTVPVRALKLGRQGRAVELNPGYFLDGVKHCQATERQVSIPSLFDLLDDVVSTGEGAA